MTLEDLEKCKKCGGEGEFHTNPDVPRIGLFYIVTCSNVNCSNAKVRILEPVDKEGAADRWNEEQRQ